MNDEFKFEDDGRWTRKVVHVSESGKAEDMRILWDEIPMIMVPRSYLLMEYEKLVLELSDKEVELSNVKEEFTVKEFDIVFKSDINFKELYGSTSEKVRKQHAKECLSDLANRKASLELSVEYLRMYIGLLKETIRSKGQ